MDTKQTFSLSYDDLTGECVKMIKELQTNADSLDGIGFALEQAKIQAVLVLWSRLATAGKACQLGVTVRNLETLYGFDTRKINGDEERRITRQNDRIVFIFPTHWFNITPMMKAYMNDTWGSVGPDLWKGKEMLIVTTAAGDDSTYGKNGRTGTELADVFTPMKASALHAGMTWLPPLVFQGVRTSQLPEYQRQLIERLTK